MGLSQPWLGPGPGSPEACTGATVCSPVVVVVPVVVPVVPVVPVVVPVVPVVVVPVVLVPVVVVPVVVGLGLACPHAGDANTNTKVRAANIVRK